MNTLGLRILKSFEACKLTAYWDPNGKVFTVGWGATGHDITEGTTWSQKQADAALSATLTDLGNSIQKLVTRPLDDNQLSALVDFTYNEGFANLKSSTLLRRVNAGTWNLVPDEFAKWHLSGGVSLRGLITRRRAEACLFMGDISAVEAILAARQG